MVKSKVGKRCYKVVGRQNNLTSQRQTVLLRQAKIMVHLQMGKL